MPRFPTPSASPAPTSQAHNRSLGPSMSGGSSARPVPSAPHRLSMSSSIALSNLSIVPATTTATSTQGAVPTRTVKPLPSPSVKASGSRPSMSGGSSARPAPSAHRPPSRSSSIPSSNLSIVSATTATSSQGVVPTRTVKPLPSPSVKASGSRPSMPPARPPSKSSSIAPSNLTIVSATTTAGSPQGVVPTRTVKPLPSPSVKASASRALPTCDPHQPSTAESARTSTPTKVRGEIIVESHHTPIKPASISFDLDVVVPKQAPVKHELKNDGARVVWRTAEDLARALVRARTNVSGNSADHWSPSPK